MFVKFLFFPFFVQIQMTILISKIRIFYVKDNLSNPEQNIENKVFHMPKFFKN